MDLAKTKELAAILNRMLEPTRIAGTSPPVTPHYDALDQLAETDPAPVRAAELLEELLEEATTAHARDARRQRLTLVLVVANSAVAVAGLLIAVASFVVK
jgi:hypothetical protein